MIQVIGFVVTLVVQICSGLMFLMAVSEGKGKDYRAIRNAFIFDTIGFYSNLFNYMVVAVVINKSL